MRAHMSWQSAHMRSKEIKKLVRVISVHGTYTSSCARRELTWWALGSRPSSPGGLAGATASRAVGGLGLELLPERACTSITTLLPTPTATRTVHLHTKNKRPPLNNPTHHPTRSFVPLLLSQSLPAKTPIGRVA